MTRQKEQVGDVNHATRYLDWTKGCGRELRVNSGVHRAGEGSPGPVTLSDEE